MKSELSKLLDAQEIDNQIDALVRSKKEYPSRMTQLKKDVDDMEATLKDLDDRLRDNPIRRKLIEDEIAAERESLVMRDKRLLETKTNKEYNAVQQEIEQSRVRIESLENQDLELMQEFERIEPEAKELRERYETISAENTAAYNEIKVKYDSIESDIAALDAKREASLDGIGKRAHSVYTRLRKGKSGLAIVVVDPLRLSCRGCHKQLPPQKVLEVRRADRMIFCESCGRVLVWDDRINGECN